MLDRSVALAGLVALAVAALAGWLSFRAERLAEGDRQGRRRRRGPSSGVVVGVATVAGAVLVAPLGGFALRLLGVAVVLGAVGMAGDHRPMRPSVRVAAEAAAGAAAVVVGMRTELTGATVTNAAMVVAFVVVMVESLRLFDAAPRAAAAVAAPSVATLAVVASGAGQEGIAVLAFALAAALAGLLASGARRPFWLGESGCLFAGFLLATLVVAVTPATPAPLSIALLLPVTAVPLLNTAVVTLDRLRRRRSLTARRPDGIPHRLRALPLPWAKVLLVLGGFQALLGVAVVLADRGVVSVVIPGWGMTGVLLLAVPGRAKVHRHPAPGPSPTTRLVGLGLVVVAIVAVVPAGVALARARAEMTGGATAAERALAAARDGDVEAASSAFVQAESSFTTAADLLDGPLASLGLAVPVLGPNLSAARSLSTMGLALTGAGSRVATGAAHDLTVDGGRVPVEEVARLAPDLARAAEAVRRAETTTAAIDRAFLLPSLRGSLGDLDVRLERAAGDAELAAQTAAVLPAILGADGPRRYFLAIQNNAELRATGGFMGNYGEVVADDGVLRLERMGRHQDLNEAGPEVKDLVAPQDYLDRYSRFEVASTWESVNLSPDFPTVSQVISGLYPQSGGRPVDGVIGIDPVGLSALLSLTGPVEVEGWPEPITAENVVGITLDEAYVAFDEELDERIDFLGEVAAASVEAFSERDLGNPARIAGALAAAARGGHLSVSFPAAGEQALVDALGIAGRVEPVTDDSLLVTNQNAAANKIDYYFRRRVDYDVALRPGDDRIGVSARLGIDMENQAPDEGLPAYVIGPFDERFEAGQNFSYVSLYSPFAFTGATWDGAPVALEPEEELGRNVYSAFLSIPARSTRRLEVHLEGSVAPVAGGWYELDLLHQPLLVAEEVTVSLEVPRGWRIAEAEGAQLEGARRAVAHLVLEQDERIRVRLVEDP